jgi:hypothetical protein
MSKHHVELSLSLPLDAAVASSGGPWAVYGGGGVAASDGQGGLYAQFGDLTWSNT